MVTYKNDSNEIKLDLNKVDIFVLICLAVGIRSIVSLHSYSGAGKPPMYGDYEAQRHWQEITINLDIKDWYRNTTDNDLMYWGLDYPPLTAYHSYLMGAMAKLKNSSFIELKESRGFESGEHKNFMRTSVLVADICIYIPGVIFLGIALTRSFKTEQMLIPYALTALLYPGQILIDNGHFQYNNISLGLAAFAIGFILIDRIGWATVFFTLALNYKQMELYHAFPFFFYILRLCFQKKSILQGGTKLVKVAGIVLGAFAIIYIPWLHPIDSLLGVFKRLFPISRGVFEDKVANFWCALNVVYKLKHNISNEQMALLCLGTTVAAIIPVNLHNFLTHRKECFIYDLINTAMAFFMFSFQVHEKSVLLVALPVFCLTIFKPTLSFWFLEVSTFSMLPLLMKDGLVLPFFATLYIYNFCIKEIYLYYFDYKDTIRKQFTFVRMSTYIILIISGISIFCPPPTAYPFLWPLIISLFSCAVFVIFLLLCTLYQFKL